MPKKYGRPQDMPVRMARGGTIQEEADETGTVSAFFKNLFSALTTNETLPKRFRLFIKKHGREPITSIKVVRAPVANVANTVMNLITRGNFAEFKRKAGIDTVFHVGLMMNEKYVFEKLERLEAREEPGHAGKGTESFPVPLGKEITIAEFLEQGRKKMGGAFYTYNALSSNCQDFTLSMLSANGLLTPDVRQFAKQDTDELVKQFSTTEKAIAEKVTDVARDTSNVVDELLYKRGGNVRPMMGAQRGRRRF